MIEGVLRVSAYLASAKRRFQRMLYHVEDEFEVGNCISFPEITNVTEISEREHVQSVRQHDHPIT